MFSQHQAVNVNATHLATDAHLEDGGHNQPMNYVPTTSTYNFYDPASIMAAYSAQSSAAAGGVNADSARQHTAVMSQVRETETILNCQDVNPYNNILNPYQVRYSAQLGVQALNAKLQQAAQLLASTPNINEAMELCQVMTACSTAIQSLQALL